MGSLRVTNGSFYAQTDNDFFAFWAGKDRFRTAALEVGYGMIGAGFQLVTGDPKSREKISGIYKYGNEFRSGSVYLRIAKGRNEYRYGVNSETMRRIIQHRFHDAINFLGTTPVLEYLFFMFNGEAGYFQDQGGEPTGYGSVGTDDPFTIY